VVRESDRSHLGAIALRGSAVTGAGRTSFGNLRGVSGTVLDAISGALMLDDAEREHLFDLARIADGATPGRRASSTPSSDGWISPFSRSSSTATRD
jgi:hypothetical protein